VTILSDRGFGLPVFEKVSYGHGIMRCYDLLQGIIIIALLPVKPKGQFLRKINHSGFALSRHILLELTSNKWKNEYQYYIIHRIEATG
jgi:hypothetical protein